MQPAWNPTTPDHVVDLALRDGNLLALFNTLTPDCTEAHFVLGVHDKGYAVGFCIQDGVEPGAFADAVADRLADGLKERFFPLPPSESVVVKVTRLPWLLDAPVTVVVDGIWDIVNDFPVEALSDSGHTLSAVKTDVLVIREDDSSERSLKDLKANDNRLRCVATSTLCARSRVALDNDEFRELTADSLVAVDTYNDLASAEAAVAELRSRGSLAVAFAPLEWVVVAAAETEPSVDEADSPITTLTALNALPRYLVDITLRWIGDGAVPNVTRDSQPHEAWSLKRTHDPDAAATDIFHAMSSIDAYQRLRTSPYTMEAALALTGFTGQVRVLIDVGTPALELPANVAPFRVTITDKGNAKTARKRLDPLSGAREIVVFLVVPLIASSKLLDKVLKVLRDLPATVHLLLQDGCSGVVRTLTRLPDIWRVGDVMEISRLRAAVPSSDAGGMADGALLDAAFRLFPGERLAAAFDVAAYGGVGMCLFLHRLGAFVSVLVIFFVAHHCPHTTWQGR